MEKGITDDGIESWCATVKSMLPETLKEQMGGWESKSFRSTRFNIWVANPKATLDVMWFLIRQIGKGKAIPPGSPNPVAALKINGVWPQITSERSPEDAPRLQAMGELLGGTRRALTEEGGWQPDQITIVPDWKQNKIKVTLVANRRELLLVTLATNSLLPTWEQTTLEELHVTSEAILAASRR